MDAALKQKHFLLSAINFLNTDNNVFFSELKATRYKLLDMLPDPRNSGLAMEQALSAYLALLQGMIEAPDGTGAPSKLRHALLFKWSHSLLGTVPQ